MPDPEPDQPARVRGGLGGWRYWVVTTPIVVGVTGLIIFVLTQKF